MVAPGNPGVVFCTIITKIPLIAFKEALNPVFQLARHCERSEAIQFFCSASNFWIAASLRSSQ
ncbi:MAG TPA: hypothetical protein VF501_11025 [Thiobacillus sp.]